ncbi:MAG: hypothetical protein Q4C25_09540, partial [Bacillota bacterium]|nr:hypothetical protein [Bacillota bacterium]
VFLFVVMAVTSEYTTFQHQEAEAAKMGYSDYFYNYSEDRVVLKKSDGSQFTDADVTAMNSVANVESVSINDIMLDNTLYIEQGDFSYEVFPRIASEFEGKLVEGRMPEADNEVILTGDKEDYYFSDPEMIGEILNKTYTTYIGEDKEINVTVVGIGYKEMTENYYIYGGDIYFTDNMMSQLLKETYNYNSTVTTTINGKAQVYSEGSSLYRVVPSSKVAQGQAVVPEETNNFYEKGDAKGKAITVTAENIYYTQTVSLNIADVYTKKTFESKTGFTDYESHSGTVYISQADYDTLFRQGNYQATVYVSDVDEMETTTGLLADMGYVTLPLKDILMTFGDQEILSIIQVPMAVIIIVALFFIAYFVIRLILRSRVTYFSILRMLGLAKKPIRRILDIELFVVINIAYGIFLAVVALVQYGVIDVEYITTLVEYMKVTDYVILYAVLVLMSYLISGKFARSLFKKTAMGSYREEA